MLKEGFSIVRLQDQALRRDNINWENLDIDELTKGYLWSGVKKYLKEISP
jgi:hypothetical protein